MTRALLLAAASTFSIATPALAQHAGHSAAPGAQSQTTGDPSCPAEHAAMGHCTPKPAATAAPPPARAAPRPAPAPAATDASCPPEHAAMGHCTPKPAAAAPRPGPAAPAAAEGPSAPAAIDPSCPPEHARMGHCTPKTAAPTTPAAAPARKPVAPNAATAPTMVDPSCPPEHAAMGHCKPKTPTATDPHAAHNAGGQAAAPAAADPSCPPEHAAMGHCTPKASGAGGAAPTTDPHAGHNMGNAAAPGTPPVAPPPQAAFSGPEHAADAIFDPQLMAEKRAEELIAEHGGYTGYMVLLDRSEYRAVEGRDGYAWDWEAWYGGDYNRLWMKTEGEGVFGGSVEGAEIQALYSRAIDPWFNLQAGVRYDIRPKPDRAHLVLGIQGLAPYWFEVDGALFLSDEGDLTARFEAEYDQRITNRLILQPRVEFDLAAQDVPELGLGSGLSSAEAGLRLRYEIRREFAPYVGVQYERRFGETADFARAAGEDVGGWSFLVGLRTWF